MNEQKIDRQIAIMGLIVAILFGVFQIFYPEVRDWFGLESVQLCNRSSCRDKFSKLILKAKQNLSSMQANQPIQFPLGVNHPIRLTESRPDSEQTWQVIGSINPEGKIEAITVADLLEMFDAHLNFLQDDTLSRMPEETQVLIASSSTTYAYAPDILVIDLVAYNAQTQKIYILPNVTYNSVLKDALNAALNKEVRRNDKDVTRLVIDNDRVTQIQ
ncbi:MAG: hypothetical protein SXA11_09335 [Cyanobacteriota bacterium]|nr:hypothetical protein [Cyanobacteriota bacterium]